MAGPTSRWSFIDIQILWSGTDLGELRMMRSTLLRPVIMLAVVATACRGSSAPDGRGDAIVHDGASDSGGTYWQGVYKCCGMDAGLSCCEYPKDSPPSGSLCYRYGGNYGRCIEEGQEFSAKVLCALCCDGLQPMTVWLDESCTDPDGPASRKVCTRCGDGICTAPERRCECPEDCRD
jgi:hypothetical protein